MHAVGIKVLKNRLSEYVRLAASGETVLVLDREKVVAELVPPGSGRSLPAPDAFLAEAASRGLVRLPMLRESGPPPRLGSMPLESLLADLADSRQDRDLP